MFKLLQLNGELSSKAFKILLAVIFVFGLLVRLFNLTNNPVAMSHDELDYVLNGKMIALTRSDLTQTWQPTSLTPIETETLTSELFPVLQALVFKFLPLNLFNARILSVIFSSLTVLIIGLLVEKISKNKALALLSSLVFSLSPWSILFAHTAYEAPNALMFYLLGIYWLISLAET
ncbi:MAG: hypothetical protein IT416_02300, partial [Candidatus Pacebacteria bacterium]|nr:hypothetical protein [Candidatus Paceibacterota bacterium]